MPEDLQNYLNPTFFLDFESQGLADFSTTICTGCNTPAEKAIALYYAVRDQILYNPYDLKYSRRAMKASSILQKKSGFCVSKAVLLAALARQQKIPCRLGFADVTNHLSTAKLREAMGTDVFIYHGYTEMYLFDKWVKATPAFNLSLCTRFNVPPLDFDGTKDSIFHECNTLGQKHMEYVKDHGHFADLPFDEIFAAYRQVYPKFFVRTKAQKADDFAEEAQAEKLRQLHPFLQ